MGANVGDARIRVPDRIARGDVITVNSIVSHPMDTGFFRTKEGAPIPAYFINEVVVTYAGVEKVQLGPPPVPVKNDCNMVG